MNLLDMAMGYGDKPYKKLPMRQPMWNQNVSAPAVSTSTAKVPVGRPTTYDDYVKTSYWDEKGGVHKDYSGNFNTRQNAIVENRLREARDNQGFKDLGGLAARIVSDPFDMVMSGLDYAKGDINGGEFALSLLPIISGGLFSKFKKTQNVVEQIDNPKPNFEDLLTDLTFKRAGLSNINSLDDINFGGNAKSPLSGFYGTPHESKYAAYLEQNNGMGTGRFVDYRKASIEDREYLGNREVMESPQKGYVTSFKLNPEYV